MGLFKKMINLVSTDCTNVEGTGRKYRKGCLTTGKQKARMISKLRITPEEHSV